ncbi:MAG: hypothetical protein JW889_13695 [Verrucomicrobia bacterium]|nr:hypothetical protein [Verrucomicrobiota bacterium]
MTGLCGIVASIESVLPAGPGGKPSWLYVALCLVVPVALGVMMAAVTMGIERLVSRKEG